MFVFPHIGPSVVWGEALWPQCGGFICKNSGFSIFRQRNLFNGLKVVQQIPQRFYWEKVKSGENLRMESINFMEKNNTIDDLFYICSYKNAIKMANLFNKMIFYLLNGTRLSPHKLLERHIQEVIGLENTKFYKRRLIDYELSRRFRLGEVV